MTKLRSGWRDLRIVAKSVWVNLALFAVLVLAAAALLGASGAYPDESGLDLVVRAFHMAYLEAVTQPGDGIIPAALTFMVPVLTVLIIGEGALRVLAVYMRRREHREEWDLLVAQTFSGHTVICGAGELGRAICVRLLEQNPDAQVVLLDTRPNILAELGLDGPNVIHVQADMTSLAGLEAANCREANLVILGSGNDAYNLEAGFKAYDLNPKAEIWIRLYRSGLASMMDLSTKPNVHFFCPYERAADALVEHLQGIEQ